MNKTPHGIKRKKADEDSTTAMFLKLHLPSLPHVGLTVQPIFTVLAVKSIIEQRHGIPVCFQALYCDDLGLELEDSNTLQEENISHGSELSLVVRQETTKQIFVKTLTGKKVSFHIHASCPHELLKEIIQEREGIPPEQLAISLSTDYFVIIQEISINIQINLVPDFVLLNVSASALWSVEKIATIIASMQRVEQERIILIYKGEALDRHRTLSEYNINEGCTLECFRNTRTEVQIFVELLTGKIITFVCDIKDTIHEVEEKISRMEDISWPDLKLTYNKDFVRCYSHAA